MSDWWENVQKVYHADGYLVLGCWHPKKVGDVCLEMPLQVPGDLVKFPQPFRVIAETTGDEFIRQAVMAGYPAPRIPLEAHFYKLVTE